jgi:MBOAT, membrane-bound O-acyltransferase family
MSLLHAASDEQWPKYALGLASTPAGLYEWPSLWNVQQWKILTGREVEPISDNALFQSTSPSDYLGRRWNCLVHEFLKYGVYKPVRFVGCGPRRLTISATFVASALFHEWLLPHVFYNYPNTHGITTAFFLWQAMLVAIEAETVVVPSRTVVAGSTKPRSRQSWRMLPRQVQTALAGLGLPPAHWFMDSYIRSNLFADLQVLLPMILPVNGTVPMAQ